MLIEKKVNRITVEKLQGMGGAKWKLFAMYSGEVVETFEFDKFEDLKKVSRKLIEDELQD